MFISKQSVAVQAVKLRQSLRNKQKKMKPNKRAKSQLRERRKNNQHHPDILLISISIRSLSNKKY